MVGVGAADCSGVARYALISMSLKFELTGELVLDGVNSMFDAERPPETEQRHGPGRAQDGQ